MNSILEILQTVSFSEDKILEIYLNALNEHQAFRSYELESTIQFVTSFLSKPGVKHKGLMLLNSYLQQCSFQAIEQKGVLWTSLALKSCIPRNMGNIADLVYLVLKLLAVKTLNISEPSKMFIATFLRKVFVSLATVKPKSYISALKCIETCLRLFPGPSGSFRQIIEQFIWKFIDSCDDCVVYWSGKCLHLLQQVCGSGGISIKETWQSYQNKLLGSLHNILDLAYAGYANLSEYRIDKHMFFKTSPLQLNDEPVRRAYQVYIRFRNLIYYLLIALREPFPVPKLIEPKKILNLITRGLSVNCLLLEKKCIHNNLAIGALLPAMHVHFYELLKVLILNMQSHLAIYHVLIMGFVTDTLRWTSSKPYNTARKPYIKLRSNAYDVLYLWCGAMKHGSRCEIVAESIIDFIMHDVTPFNTDYSLKISGGTQKYLKKDVRHISSKLKNPNAYSTKNEQQILDEGNQELCVMALKCLGSFLLSAGCILKPTLIKIIHCKIINICELFYGILPKNGLYYNSWSRLEICNVLYSFIVADHRLCPPPLEIILSILQRAQTRDCHQAVRKCSLNLLNILEKMYHPQKECLLFPPNNRELRKYFSIFDDQIQLNENEGSVFNTKSKSRYEHEIFLYNAESSIIETHTKKHKLDEFISNLKSSDLMQDFEGSVIPNVQKQIGSLECTHKNKDILNSEGRMSLSEDNKTKKINNANKIKVQSILQAKAENEKKPANNNMLKLGLDHFQNDRTLYSDVSALFVDELNFM